MVCSSSVFVFGFLPVTLLVNFMLKNWRSAQNIFLVIASLFFYAWGEPRIVFLLMLSILCNYLFGLGVSSEGFGRSAKIFILLVMCGFNLGLLFVFKYLGFVGSIFHFSVPQIALPVGISFYTFQAMSYVIDVYKGGWSLRRIP